MRDITFVTETYSKRKPKDYELSISIRRDGFSFLITHKQDVMAYSYVIAVGEGREAAFKDFLAQDILQPEFKSVSIIIVSPKYTLVPKKFYDDTLLDKYVAMNFEKSENESIITYESVNTDAVLLFPIETTFWAMCRLAFKKNEIVSYVPHVAPTLEANCKSRKEKLCVSVENSFFTALFIKGKELRFCNAFEFHNVNDFLFYVMNIFEQLHLNPLEVEVELSGKINEKSAYYTAIQLFVKKVEIANPPKEGCKGLPYTLFYNHCNVALCE